MGKISRKIDDIEREGWLNYKFHPVTGCVIIVIGLLVLITIFS